MGEIQGDAKSRRASPKELPLKSLKKSDIQLHFFKFFWGQKTPTYEKKKERKMKLPRLNVLPTARELTEVFGGYDHNLRIGDGEFYEMSNLSSDNYPVLSPRGKRGIYAVPSAPRGMIAKDVLCYVDGEDFVIGEKRISMGLTDGQKALISMGSYVIIMPDKKYINTISGEGSGGFEHGDIEATITTAEPVTFELCKTDGSAYESTAVSATKPSNPSNMALWIDTSSTPHTLKQYSSASATWVDIATTYVKVSSTGIGKSFSEGDGVTVSGVEPEALSSLNGSQLIQAKGDDYIVLTGMLDEVTTQQTPITVSRRMPNMDFIIESGNRLWGCRYGTSASGKAVNEIYASKLGDFKNWNCFAGISTDSYVASLGTDGQFTGAVTHLGYPIFFKENCMHKVYGSYPSSYQIQTTTCRGVQRGCAASLATVNEVLYYKSRSAVCAYDGSLPVEISAALGETVYSNAVAGALGNKYYVSMMDAEGQYHLFVYDTVKCMWHREDNTQATCFCNWHGDLYYIDYADEQIKSVRGTGVTETGTIRWEAVTGRIGIDRPDKKYVSRIDIRMSLAVGARVFFYASYDDADSWEHLFTMTGTSLRSFAVPVRPKRCDHLRLRIEGYGDAKIYSICKTLEEGSDV